MSAPPVTPAENKRRKNAIEDALRKGYAPPGVPTNGPGATVVALEALGMPRNSSTGILRNLKRAGYEPDWSLWTGAPKRHAEIQSPEVVAVTLEAIAAALRKRPLTLGELAAKFGTTRGAALDLVESLAESGMNVQRTGDEWSIERSGQAAYAVGDMAEYKSRPDNTFVFGVTSDNHLGSKYERLDVLNDLYDEFEKHGVDRAFNAGNWVEGESSFNRHELLVHGMDAQLRYLAANFPKRDGITTYAVSGDDHEGWWAQREGVDIGRYAQRVMAAAEREDWVNLGYMEAHVNLVNANTGKSSVLALVHPGGGSAYALSYSIQKTIESLDGGEKPAVGIYGHYHKLWAGNIRNVWCLQAGCTKDQDSFMRKRKIEAHVGGTIVTLRQDEETGAITGFLPDMRRYFNKGYYEGRWSHSGPVTLAKRGK